MIRTVGCRLGRDICDSLGFSVGFVVEPNLKGAGRTLVAGRSGLGMGQGSENRGRPLAVVPASLQARQQSDRTDSPSSFYAFYVRTNDTAMAACASL